MNNNQQTIQKLEGMRFKGMARAFKAILENGMHHKLTGDELITHLVDTEWDDRKNRRLGNLVRQAHFRYAAYLEDLDFSPDRNISKEQILRLADCGWIVKGKDIIITGATGVGKSYFASVLGHQACVNGFKVSYFSSRKLFTKLKLSKSDGTYLKEISKLSKKDLLIIDDFGLEKLDIENRLNFLDIVEDRNIRKSTIIVSQIPVNKWHKIIADPTIADAICDRLVHHSHRFQLKGESLRKKYKND